MDISALPLATDSSNTINSSALDVLDAPYAGSNTSLNVIPPGHLATSERIRRRSEISRFRAPDSPLALRSGVAEPTLDNIELPVLTSIREDLNPFPSGSAASGKYFEAERERNMEDGMRRPGDLENLGGAASESIAMSSVVGQPEGETGSTMPIAAVLTEEERRALRMKSRVHFGALCYCFFLEGWNDGSTGPLLPSIQKHYGVCLYASVCLKMRLCILIVCDIRLDSQLSRSYSYSTA